MQKLYRSKLDTWLALVLGFAMIMSTVAAVSAIAAGGWQYAWAAAITIFFGIFILWILRGTFYILDGKILTVRSGPFKWRVPIDEITGITPTHNPLSSPALSLDRLRIEYGNGRSIMISPENKDEFIADIEAAK